MIVPLERSHLEYVTHNMREIDWRELSIAGPSKSYYVDLVTGIDGNKWCVLKDEPIVVMGIRPFNGFGIAWMWATDRISEVGLELTRFAKAECDKFSRKIVAHSAPFHSDAHRWLEALGYVRKGPMGKFIRFERNV